MRPGDISRVVAAIEELRDIDFPRGYLDTIRKDMLDTLIKPRPNGKAYCYLAFFGPAEDCHYLKVGMSNNPRARIRSFMTGNPMRPVISFVACCSTNKAARLIEQTTLKFLADRKAAGEWIALGGIPIRQAMELVGQVESHTGAKFTELRG